METIKIKSAENKNLQKVDTSKLSFRADVFRDILIEDFRVIEQAGYVAQGVRRSGRARRRAFSRGLSLFFLFFFLVLSVYVTTQDFLLFPPPTFPVTCAQIQREE